jgi:hypothetical protein
MGHRPFLKRYLKRDEILFNITACDAVLNDALGMFGVGIFFYCSSRDIRLLTRFLAALHPDPHSQVNPGK